MLLNSLILTLIESPVHRTMPGGLTEISYTGPVSGRFIRLPALSVVDGRRFLIVAGRPEHKQWWRTFREARPARLIRGGHRYDVIGHVLSGTERSDALTTYLAAHPVSRHMIGSDIPVIAFAEVAS